MKRNQEKIRKMVGIAFLMAIVVVLQMMGQFIKIGPVSISLVLLPIVVGAAMYGPVAGAVLGGTFGCIVLMQADTMFFLDIHFLGTVITVLVKGVLSGWLAGLTYRLLAGKSRTLAVFAAAVVCPLVNTGVFFLGCRLFFWEAMTMLGQGNALLYVVTVMIGWNFVAEFAMNIVCAPVVHRVLDAVKRR